MSACVKSAPGQTSAISLHHSHPYRKVIGKSLCWPFSEKRISSQENSLPELLTICAIRDLCIKQDAWSFYSAVSRNLQILTRLWKGNANIYWRSCSKTSIYSNANMNYPSVNKWLSEILAVLHTPIRSWYLSASCVGHTSFHIPLKSKMQEHILTKMKLQYFPVFLVDEK